MSKRRPTLLSSKKKVKDAPNARFILLEPVGYPLRVQGDDPSLFRLTTDDPELFAQYAKKQWHNLTVQPGDFLIDSLMFPDFSFRVVRVVPRVARLTRSSRITLLNKKTEKYPLSPHFKPAVRFSDIVGQIEAKQKCLVILKYLEDPQSFGTWAPHNILLCGPPGTGKTMTAKALACEAKVEILPVRASDLLGSFVGDASGRIHKLFDEARYHAPSVIFIDELDVIALQRNFQSIRGDVTEVVSALLSELDGVFENQGVVTLAASNRFDMLDEAIKSRFEQIIEFKLPTLEEREDILAINSTLSPISIHANMRRIATLTTNWSGRDLKEKLLRRAIHAAIINNEEEITEETLTKIIEKQKTHPKQLYT